MKIQDLPTPALLLDADLFEANILRMAEHTARAGKALRPHAKAHKCVSIAKRQVEAGAVGICVATVNEAEWMANSGVPSVLLTSPLADAAKCARIVALCSVAEMVAVVDHPDQARLYSDAAKRAGTTLKVLVDLDLGDHRTGCSPGQPALDLARQIDEDANLMFTGLQAYSVKASHMSQPDGVAEFSAGALGLAAATKEVLEKDGIATPVITGGSTGTHAVDSQLPYVTELQAGSYALMDVAYAKIGIHEFGHAMTVLSTVVSANHPDRVTVDAGFKAFATDRTFGPDVLNLGGARHEWAGDEFSYVFTAAAERRPRLGERLRFIPPHCDPTVNLYDRIHVCSGDLVLETWSVMDRARTSRHNAS